MHTNQLAISAETVRELVDEQFPAWRGLRISAVRAPGTVNAIFRIGDQLAARFPARARGRRVGAQRAGAGGGRRPRTGRRAPGSAPPSRWRWANRVRATRCRGRCRPGCPDTATDDDPGESAGFAHDLAEFVAGVRQIATRGRTFRGQGRGGDLRSHDAWMETCFARSGPLLDVPRLRRIWQLLRDLPRAPGGDVMSHGDLIPGNVLVSGGRLAGILDVGGLGPADPALDLVAAWHLLGTGPRQVLRAELGSSDLDWARGQAWAFEQAMGLVWYYAENNPAMSLLGRRTLRRIQQAGAAR